VARVFSLPSSVVWRRLKAAPALLMRTWRHVKRSVKFFVNLSMLRMSDTSQCILYTLLLSVTSLILSRAASPFSWSLVTSTTVASRFASPSAVW